MKSPIYNVTIATTAFAGSV